MNDFARLIAFYLPQYHPIPENDAWWGKGFTEWTNVTKARPLFPGHDQPHLPADLGFYDLRLPETRQAQADLAQAYGIHGFCYYHYWFNGRRLLDRPFQEVLDSQKPNFPFCLCWANENWTRAWDGLEQNVLMGQNYNAEDDRQHIRWLAHAFRDARYIRVDGKPLFIVYRISNIPDPYRTAMIWREEAQTLGLGDIYLCTVESLRGDRLDPARIGFDAAIEFQPDWLNLPRPKRLIGDGNSVYQYSEVVEHMQRKATPPYKLFPCVTPKWDNTSRRQKDAFIFHESTPELYQNWLETAIGKIPLATPDENLVFVNAWNEWGEGAYLEPCRKWGTAYLEATRRALQNASPQRQVLETSGVPADKSGMAAPVRVSVCIPAFNGAAFIGEALQSVLSQSLTDFELVVVDDCSTDNTEAVIRSFVDPRLRYIRNPARLGLVGNWNKCIEVAAGTYLCIFHQDDVMLPDNLEKKVRVLEAHPLVGFVHSNVIQIGPANELISEWWYSKPDPSQNGIHPGREFFKTLLLGDNIVCCPSVVARRECFEKLGVFDARLPFTADWEMWLRLALFYDVAFLVESLIKYRRHPGNETLNFPGAKSHRQYYEAKRIALDKYPDRVPDRPLLWKAVVQESQRQALEHMRIHYRQRQFDAARHHVTFALELAETLAQFSPNQTGANSVLNVVDELWRQPSDTLATTTADTSLSETNGNGAERHQHPLRYQPVFRQVMEELTGWDIANHVPLRKIIKAVAFKLAARPGFSWLYQLKGMARKVLG